MFRRVGVAAAAAVVIVLTALPGAQAATKEGVIQGPGGDYLGVGSTVDGLPGGVTAQAFFLACNADYQQGDEPSLVNELIASPLNGIDAQIFDLGAPKMGAFSAKGPGATDLGPPVVDPSGLVFTSPVQLHNYDLDLYFITDVAHGCNDANVADSDDKCYSTKPDPDEAVPCIKGHTGTDFKTHGARYVIVSAAMNVTGAALPFKLTTP